VQLTDTAPWGGDGTLGDALLAPTVLYVRPVLKLIQQLPVKVQMSYGHRVILAGGACLQICKRLSRSSAEHCHQYRLDASVDCRGASMCALCRDWCT
jgi:phosphoribosylaminoimidazole (AIR) synthetase